jgi:hypothetical protein
MSCGMKLRTVVKSKLICLTHIILDLSLKPTDLLCNAYSMHVHMLMSMHDFN